MADKIKGIEPEITLLDREPETLRAKREIETKIKQKSERVKAYRKEASRLASMANKRIQRLEKNNLEDSPAYRAFIENGGGKFGVRGKTHNELQQEVARMNRFLNANTSTIKGLNSYLVEMAENTGIEYSNMKELQQKAGKFFELSDKIEEYLRTVEDMASAIGYQKIWEAVNVYVQANRVDLSSADADIDNMIKAVSDAITEHQKPEKVFLNEAYNIEDGELSKNVWFKFPKKGD